MLPALSAICAAFCLREPLLDIGTTPATNAQARRHHGTSSGVPGVRLEIRAVIIVQTPLRVSLAGGGTDLREFYEIDEGRTISFAIDKYVFVIVSERFDDRIYINYTKKEIVDSVDEITARAGARGDATSQA